MEIECPKCGKKFEWNPPEDTDVFKVLTAETISKEAKPRRYSVRCPKCDTRLNVYV